jgi:transcriptional regulator with XRE-family HTH domain
MELGEKIRTARMAAGLSQRQLCGEEITRNMLSLIENGAARPSMKTLAYLAERLGKPLSFFLDEDAGEKQHLGEAWMRLNRAEESLTQGRMELARELLEMSGTSAPELERRRLLLLSRLPGKNPAEICKALPSLDEELLLRARGALAQGNADRGIRLLMAAEDQQSGTWNLLMGHLRMEQKEYAAASGYLIRAEQEFPVETAPLLEVCFRELGDYPKAYEYACKQKG